MSGLLAADQVAVLLHVLGDILVSDRGLLIADAQLIQRLVQAHVGHDGGDDLGIAEHAALLQVLGGEIEDVVAVADVSFLVYRQAAVRVPVKGKADVQLVLQHVFLKLLDMGGAAVDVDVQSVRVVGDHIGVGAQGVKDALGHHPGTAVGTVQADTLALVGAGCERDQVTEVAVTPGSVVDGLADVGALGVGKLLVAVQISLNAVQEALFHLVAVGIDELDSVVIIGIVAGGNHDAAVKVVRSRNIGDARRAGDMQQVGVRARCGEPGAESRFEHIARAAGVLADHDLGLMVFSVVPAEIPADLEGVINGQVLVGLTAKSVRSKILPHFVSFFLEIRFFTNAVCSPPSRRHAPSC